MKNEAPIDKIIAGSRLIESNAQEAIKFIREGLITEPVIGEGWYNLGIAYHQNKSIEKAIRSYRIGLKCKQSPAEEIKNNLAQDLLLNADFEEGWMLYEERLNKMREQFEIYYQMFGDPWKGKDEKRKFDNLIVIAEQGFGDSIQFCRLVLYLQKKGIKARFFCPEALAPLLKTQTEIKDICISLNGVGKGSLWVPMMSLPKLLGINGKNIPYKKGYIQTDKTLSSKWSKLLRKNTNKRLIGIHWASFNFII